MYDKNKLNTITKEEFKQIDIKDITVKDLDKITSFQLNDFMSFLHVVLENDAKTMNRKLASTKRLFESLDVNNMIFRNPTVNMEGARTEKRLPVHLTLKQSKQLLSNIINSDDRNKIRNYTKT